MLILFLRSLFPTALCHLRNISRIGAILASPDSQKLVTAFSSSRFDYCNALFLGVTKQAFDKMQLVQNEFNQELKGDLSQPSIDLKMLPIACEALNGAAPSYISDVLTAYTPDVMK